LAITEGHLCILIGSIGLEIKRENNNAELVYWLGKDYWGQGYATEAARAIISYGFDELKLHRIYARYLSHNLASGRVLEKLGMTHEGRLRGHLKKFGVYEDMEIAGLLKEEFRACSTSRGIQPENTGFESKTSRSMKCNGIMMSAR